jgi:hypothetical protein
MQQSILPHIIVAHLMQQSILPHIIVALLMQQSILPHIIVAHLMQQSILPHIIVAHLMQQSILPHIIFHNFYCKAPRKCSEVCQNLPSIMQHKSSLQSCQYFFLVEAQRQAQEDDRQRHHAVHLT